MRLLFITRKYPPAVGGMELFAKELSDVLATKTDLTLVKWSGYGMLKAVLVGVPNLTIRAFWQLGKGDTDVVHVQDGVLAPTGWLLAKLFRKPYVVVIHGLDITFKNPLFKAVVPWAVRRADAVLCISQAAADEAIARGVPKDKISTIPLAVGDILHGKANRSDLIKVLKLPNDSQILLTVGRLVKRKGVAWFINNVLPALVSKYSHLVYLVVGEGAERPMIEAAIQQHQLGDHVRLLGRTTDKLYQAAYNGAGVFVMPNIAVPGDVEGFGLVSLEASLCERPIVAAKLEGIQDALQDGRNGVLIDSQDAAGFERAISQFLDDPGYAQQFGRASRQFTLDHYQWPVIAEQYIEQYRKLLS